MKMNWTTHGFSDCDLIQFTYTDIFYAVAAKL